MKFIVIRDSNSYLQHFGIKGMKWGIRRTPNKTNHKNLKNKSEKISKAKKNISKYLPKGSVKSLNNIQIEESLKKIDQLKQNTSNKKLLQNLDRIKKIFISTNNPNYNTNTNEFIVNMNSRISRELNENFFREVNETLQIQENQRIQNELILQTQILHNNLMF